MERKFTDDEIVKALDCCFIHSNCTNCPLQSPPTEGCLRVACTQAIDFINRQKEEIDRLEVELKAMRGAANSYKAEVEELRKGLNIWTDIAHRETQYVEQAKSEAIKEFAERLRHYIKRNMDDGYGCVVYLGDIYNLVKEMTGGQK